MQDNSCPICGRSDRRMVKAPCLEDSKKRVGVALGMYHCPDCGAMLVAGVEHPKVCANCAMKVQFDIIDPKFNWLREALARYAHDAWSGWMKYLFDRSLLNENGTVTIPRHLVNRWMRQMNTDYNHLSEDEKDSDRKEADKMISIFVEALQDLWEDDG